MRLGGSGGVRKHLARDRNQQHRHRGCQHDIFRHGSVSLAIKIPDRGDVRIAA
jgi:hypothetical protein